MVHFVQSPHHELGCWVESTGFGVYGAISGEIGSSGCAESPSCLSIISSMIVVVSHGDLRGIPDLMALDAV